jgi:hypothetical protein
MIAADKGKKALLQEDWVGVTAVAFDRLEHKNLTSNWAVDKERAVRQQGAEYLPGRFELFCVENPGFDWTLVLRHLPT